MTASRALLLSWHCPQHRDCMADCVLLCDLAVGAEPQPGRPERSSSMGSSGGEQEGTPEGEAGHG